jgi:alkylation response protein AidB-like acyl-CoA dehydrogenase
MPYNAPIKDMLFLLEHLVGIEQLQKYSTCDEASLETSAAVLEESARFTQEVVAPLNAVSDQNGAILRDGVVLTSPKFKNTFSQYVQGGWQGLPHEAEFGGQGLPKSLATGCHEMLHSASMSFALCPMLTDAAIEALITAGTPEQQSIYLPPLLDGRWTGTMNLTEPQAGSDLAMLRAKAVKQPEGSYRLSGTKIFITYGDHDYTDNIIHMVLARTPDAPEGVKGISLFLVPKFLVNPNGSLGARNEVTCVSLEHKLGIHGSPTCVLQYGENQGAVAYLVGEENRGLEYMFIMMNAARFAVGVQGIGVAERAYQHAVAYAKERTQGRDLSAKDPNPVPIIRHPDVRRMLMWMKANIEGARALAFVVAGYADLAKHHDHEDERAYYRSLYEFCVPLVKGWSTEMAVDVASQAVQVHGGMGYIEETGIAQLFRDARITTIYEGTTAIQANDFVGRKTAKDEGKIAEFFIKQIRTTILALQKSTTLNRLADPLEAAVSDFEMCVRYVVANAKTQTKEVFSGSVPYLKLSGILLSAWQMARAAVVAEECIKSQGNIDFLQAKINTATFYIQHILPQTTALRVAILTGGNSVMSMDEGMF